MRRGATFAFRSSFQADASFARAGARRGAQGVRVTAIDASGRKRRRDLVVSAAVGTIPRLPVRALIDLVAVRRPLGYCSRLRHLRRLARRLARSDRKPKEKSPSPSPSSSPSGVRGGTHLVRALSTNSIRQTADGGRRFPTKICGTSGSVQVDSLRRTSKGIQTPDATARLTFTRV